MIKLNIFGYSHIYLAARKIVIEHCESEIVNADTIDRLYSPKDNPYDISIQSYIDGFIEIYFGDYEIVLSGYNNDPQILDSSNIDWFCAIQKVYQELNDPIIYKPHTPKETNANNTIQKVKRQLRKKLLHEYDYRCYTCLDRPDNISRLHMHRVVKGSDNGKYSEENVIILCHVCHRKYENETRQFLDDKNKEAKE